MSTDAASEREPSEQVSPARPDESASVSNGTPESSSPQSTDGMPRWWRTRLAVGFAIPVLGLAAILTQWFRYAPDRTYQVMWVWIVAPGTILFTLLWWILLSPLSGRIRLRLAIASGTVLALLFAAVRVDGFTGAMVPILRWRWSPSDEQRARAFWNERRTHPAREVDAAPEPLQIRADDWPEYRGAQRDGMVRGLRFAAPPDWRESPPDLLWRIPVGPGHSSLAVADGLVFTQEQRESEECVVCYDLETGGQVWVHADETRFSEFRGGDGPRATPTVTPTHLYSLGATGILNCLDPRTGRRIWSVNVLESLGQENLVWGMSGSPLVVDDWVIVAPGGDGHAVVAYDRLTGKRVWAAGSRRGSYCSPRVEEIGGIRQLLVFDGDGLSAYRPDNGEALWHFPWTNAPRVNAAQPIRLEDGSILIGSGYATGAARLDVAQKDGGWSVVPRWTSLRFKLKFNDAVVRGGYAYGLDEAILTCLDLSDGRTRWKRGRYGYGQLLLIDDVLLILSEKGEVALVEASPERYREITRFQAIEGRTWNHPALAEGRLLVRNSRELACFDLRPLLVTHEERASTESD